MKYWTILLPLIFTISCQNDLIIDDSKIENEKIESRNIEIDNYKTDNLYTLQYVMEYVNSDILKDWTTKEDAIMVYSIGHYTDQRYIVGFEYENMNSAKSSCANLLQKYSDMFEDITPNTRSELPFLLIKTDRYEVIEVLMDEDFVKYVEPSAEYLFVAKDNVMPDILNLFGCSCPDEEVDSKSWTTLSPAVKKSWHYDYHFISEDNWNLSSGDDIGVVVIDTGVSFDQENLDNTQDFSSGQSQNRQEYRENFLYAKIDEYRSIELPYNLDMDLPIKNLPIPIEVTDKSATADDQCGHGTKMAGTVAAPRGSDGNSVGIAYSCNLYNYRAVHNPIIITALEKIAVADALFFAASSIVDAQIISMSIGQPPLFINDLIKQGIKFAYDQGMLINCAAGTLKRVFNPIIDVYPASDFRTLAITGLIEPDNWPGSLTLSDNLCSTCFNGGADFASIIQRKSLLGLTGNTGISVNCDGDAPTYSGGTSSATSNFSGISALLWSHLGINATRGEVMERLKSSSSNISGSHPIFGHGWVNLNKALL